MRTPVISAFTKNVRTRRTLATAVATVALGVALPVLGGGTSAWACGNPELDGPKTAPAGAANVNPQVTIGSDLPNTAQTDGSWNAFSLRILGATDHAYENAYPQLMFADPTSGERLLPGDVQAQVYSGGQWHELTQFDPCLPGIPFDTDALKTHLDAGQVTTVSFRFRLSPNTDPDVSGMVVAATGAADHATYIANSDLRRLTVHHPAAATPTKEPSESPTSKPSESAEPAGAGAAVSAAPSTATAPAATSEPTGEPSSPAKLAYTGGGDTSWTLVGAGGALLAVGGAVVVATRRRASRG
ncbi:hypothetical protein [Kitasatospora viridis]|uniref:hypothetical protein n=1 Tax=Kitasatospora viridis TaxID=281105 RepID=UPI0031DDE820